MFANLDIVLFVYNKMNVQKTFILYNVDYKLVIQEKLSYSITLILLFYPIHLVFLSFRSLFHKVFFL